MTLVLSVHSRESLWLLVDRRLSYGGRRPPIDDAVKVLDLETLDGRGLLAYAGLGATSRGTQPSEWMSNVLRGRGGLQFEQALSIVSNAANRELPRYLRQMPGGAHFIIVPAFVRGKGSRLYSIDNAVNHRTGAHHYRFTSHQRTADPTSPSVRLALGGTGGMYLQRVASRWVRPLLRLVKAHDGGSLSDLAIADFLAGLNYEAHRAVHDGSVGPRCIVVWRRRPDARPSLPGSAHQFYTGVEREATSGVIPAIGNGLDVAAIVGVLMAHYQTEMAENGFPVFGVDHDQMNQALEQLPSDPDERLR